MAGGVRSDNFTDHRHRLDIFHHKAVYEHGRLFGANTNYQTPGGLRIKH